MKIIKLDQIKTVLNSVDILPALEQGFILYSTGKTIVPPIGELVFNNPLGDVHIKYGYILEDPYYVVKIASGFYENPKLNLPSSNGLILIFSQKTGAVLAILLDEGYLTDIRTAAAGAIVAKYLASRNVKRIGIIGTGTQAKMQLSYLKRVTDCREVIVWGRHPDKLRHFKNMMEADGFHIDTTQTIVDVTSTCNLIVTTTPSSSPLLWENQIRKGTHITAIGADSSYKQELDPYILEMADIVVADSITQCLERGDISHAIKNDIIEKKKLIELGNIISGESPGRTSDTQITVADLTGVVVQDIQIAKCVYEMIHPN